jgi:hypothetical protein
MQLEAGKKYTDRRGRVYGPMMLVGDVAWIFGESPDDYGWFRDGSRSPSKIMQGDLVAEYVEPVKDPEPEYRMLQDGETVLPGDEYLGHSQSWEKVPTSGGVFKSSIHYPHRRRVEPATVDPGEGYRLLEPHEVTLPDDERAYVYAEDDFSSWDTLTRANGREFVGVTVDSLKPSRPEMVIRRKLPPKTRTIILKEYACWDDDCPESVYIEWSSSCPTRETLKYFGCDNAHATGNERTIEIPLTT